MLFRSTSLFLCDLRLVRVLGAKCLECLVRATDGFIQCGVRRLKFSVDARLLLNRVARPILGVLKLRAQGQQGIARSSRADYGFSAQDRTARRDRCSHSFIVKSGERTIKVLDDNRMVEEGRERQADRSFRCRALARPLRALRGRAPVVLATVRRFLCRVSPAMSILNCPEPSLSASRT